MKSLALGLAVLLALAIAWLVWRSRSAQTPPVVAQTPAASAAAQPAKETPVANPPEAAPAQARTDLAPQPAASAAASPALESAEILVRGSVRDEHGQPVPDATLRWIDEQGRATDAGVANGSYAQPGLHPGTFLVQLSGPGLQREQLDVVLPVQPASQEHDFTARDCARILIKLIDPQGAPTYGGGHGAGRMAWDSVHVLATKQALAKRLEPGERLDPGRTECGIFEGTRDFKSSLGSQPPEVLGVLELLEKPPLFVSLVLGTAVLESREIVDVPAELVFTFRQADLDSKLSGVRARLLQTDGRTPVAKGGLTLLSPNGGSGQGTDADGRVEILGLLPGGYTIRLGSKGLPSVMRQVELEPGQVLDLGDVALVALPTLEVRFDFGGQPEQALEFTFRQEFPGSPLRTLKPWEPQSFGCRAAEKSQVPFPGAGSFLLLVSQVGGAQQEPPTHLGAQPQRVVLGEVPVEPIVVRILPTTVVQLRPALDQTSDSSWLVSTLEGLPCRRVSTEGRAPQKIELPPGEYTIARVQPESGSLGEAQSFRVGAGTLTVELKP